ncbi:hypothetical protein GGQ80_002609 [Sphingomonas jinjuensis]|uniref:Colicin transporter n=1 Tax=Sphingomonas jinjuensis TaxID=535907 RepID=A0A840F5Z2_9SPHN|nr:hypothetical protein [Sphingomonas jinjuensis]MBB4154693.1 hypothetical protein [Sphingomonas jinjuensis]
MTAAYRLRGIGWFAACVAIVLAFYLVSLQVAAERKKLDQMNARIGSAERDIRALETEFNTRANLAQLERWNGETLALSAPTARQFVGSEAALASIDVNQPAGPVVPGQSGGAIQTAALVVPSMPTPIAPATPTPAQLQVAAALPAAKPSVIRVASVTIDRAAPAAARATHAARGAAAVAKVRPEAVAMLDKKLLSDTTLGDILTNARREARVR